MLAAVGLMAGCSANAGGAGSVYPPSLTQTTVPGSINTSCGSDATSALNTFFSGLSAGAQVVLPANACFLVSNSNSSLLQISGTSGVNINGNGATFEQTSYPCNTSDPVNPVLGLYGNNALQITNLTVEGAGTSCGGAANEGDYGVMVGSTSTGNNGITLDDVTIEDTNGDGLPIYPNLGSNNGVNSNVTFENGAMSNIGYHAVTPEGVIGLTISHDTFNDVGNFMDLEVDGLNCGMVNCYNAGGNPVGAAQWNVTVENNIFTNGLGGNWIEAEQSPCIPAKNWLIEGNSLDSTVPSNVTLFGSASTTCSKGLDDNLQILNNQASYPVAPNFANFSIFDWSHVTITGNTVMDFHGLPTYFPDEPQGTGAGLCGVTDGTVQGNTFNDFASPYSPAACFDTPAGLVTTGVKECADSYSLTVPDVICTAANPPWCPTASGTYPSAQPATTGTC